MASSRLLICASACAPGQDHAIRVAHGHHLFVAVGNGSLTSLRYLYSKLPYDASTDFAPWALMGATPLVWVTAKVMPERTVASYAQQLRKEGDKQTDGSIGLAFRGHVGMSLLLASTLSPLVQSRELEALAVTSAQRSPLAPTLGAWSSRL